LFYGWWVVAACAGISFLTGGTFFYGFGTLISPMSREMGWSRAFIAGAFSLRTEVGGAEAAVVGYLIDRVGPRRLLIAGGIFVGAGFIVFSRIQEIWQLYATVSLIALGMGFTGGAVGYAAVARWFYKKRGWALAWMTVGVGISGVMVLVLSSVIDAFGWRTALVIMGLTQWVLIIPMALIVRDRPQDMGLLPDGEPARPAQREVAAGQRQAPAVDPEGPGDSTARLPDEGFTVRQAVRTRTFWFLALAMGFVGMGSQAVVVHQIPFMEDSLHFTTQSAAVVAMTMPIVSLTGRLGFGRLADYVDKQKVLAMSYLCMGVGVLLLAMVHSPWQILFYLAVFSPGWGGSLAVRPAYQADYFGLRAFGGIQGWMMTISAVGSVFGPIFAGAMYDITEGYRPAFLIVGLVALTAVPAVLMAGRSQKELARAAGTAEA
jgi:MFS family permease